MQKKKHAIWLERGWYKFLDNEAGAVREIRDTVKKLGTSYGAIRKILSASQVLDEHQTSQALRCKTHLRRDDEAPCSHRAIREMAPLV